MAVSVRHPRQVSVTDADRLRMELEQNVALLSMLQPSWERLTSRKDTDPCLQPSVRSWHLFLNQMAFLMDYLPGGKSVGSATAEQRHNRCTFWLASNNKHSPTAVEHIKNVLKVLQRVAQGKQPIKDAQDWITSKSIALSSERVAFYAGQISRSAKECLRFRHEASGTFKHDVAAVHLTNMQRRG